MDSDGVKTTRTGRDDWDDLIGKEISFEWMDGFEDFPYWFHGTFEGTTPVPVYPGYPKYYILVDGGGVAVYDEEPVEVTVYG